MMTRMVRTLSGLVTLAAFAGSAKPTAEATISPLPSFARAAQPMPSTISWADTAHRHGWAVVNSTDPGTWCPSSVPSSRLCATEDGGRTWKPILFVAVIGRAVIDRTSRRAGFAVLYGYSYYPLWTRDGGTHWYSTLIFSGSPSGLPKRISGKGSHVRWTSEGGATYRIAGWPPTGVVKCPGEWVSGLGISGTRPNICQSPAFVAGHMRSTPVSRPPLHIAWADAGHRHGWVREQHSGKMLCAATRYRTAIRHYQMSALCATEDGGRTWHPIFYTDKSRIMGFVHTSLRTGWVVAGFRAQEWYSTFDNGRYWHNASFLGPPGFPFFSTFLAKQPGLYFRSWTESMGLDASHTAVFKLERSRATRVGTAGFDAATGTGFLSAENARLAADWSQRELLAHAFDHLSFEADLHGVWNVTCVSGTGVQSTVPVEGVEHVVVKSHPVQREIVFSGFSLDGYGEVEYRDGAIEPPALGSECHIQQPPDYPVGHVQSVQLSADAQVWLRLLAGVTYDVGNFPYPADPPG
jgi:hypothetical protein